MTFAIIPVHTDVIDKESKRKMRSLSSENRVLAEKLDDLEGSVDRLTLITQALWELLQDKVGISESELTTLIEEIDLRDGVLDGKFSKKPDKCARCGQTVSTRTGVCFYCGHKQSQSDIELRR